MERKKLREQFKREQRQYFEPFCRMPALKMNCNGAISRLFMHEASDRHLYDTNHFFSHCHHQTFFSPIEK